jgi:FkbM family methyltransferase
VQSSEPNQQLELQHHFHHISHFGFISNSTLSGSDAGCKFFAKYETTTVVNFQMCVGQNPIDLKNGMSIINLIQTRGYLPTCRVLHLMLWMQSETVSNSGLENRRDTFVDIGANIGSCSTHIASLGYPVISAEPVTEHVRTIRGTIETNPSFHIDLHHIGIGSEMKSINVSFGHGARNWGASVFEEDKSSQMSLDIKTVDQLVGPKR